MPRDQYQTVKEVSDRMRVSETTVRGRIRNGAWRAIEIGKGWRVAGTDFEAFLRDHATRARGDVAEAGASGLGPETGRESNA